MKTPDEVISSLRRDKAELADFSNQLLARLWEVDRERMQAAFATKPDCVHDLMQALFPSYVPAMPRPAVVSFEQA